MSKKKTIIKISTIFLLIFLLVASLIFIAVPAIASSLNTDIDREDIKVFLGDTVGLPTNILKNSYINQRTNLLNSESKNTPNKTIKAVIVFKEFIETGKLRNLMDKYSLKIDEIFVAIPYTDYAGGYLLEENMTLEDAIEEHIKGLEEVASESAGEPGSEIIAEHAKLAREKGISIYAVNAIGKAKKFKSLTDNEIVKFIDIFFHPKAEKVAKSRNL